MFLKLFSPSTIPDNRSSMNCDNMRGRRHLFSLIAIQAMDNVSILLSIVLIAFEKTIIRLEKATNTFYFTLASTKTTNLIP